MFYTMYTKPDDGRQERPKHVAVLKTIKESCWMVEIRNLSIQHMHNGMMFTKDCMLLVWLKTFRTLSIDVLFS
jgi:hypothetical protein